MIRLEGDPILKRVCKSFSFVGGDGPSIYAEALADQLAAEMDERRGLGLAAPQIGVELRAFIIINGTERLACFNPAIVVRKGGEGWVQEGCLSFPGVFVRVRRAKGVLVRFQDVDGVWREVDLVGQAAHAFQHELDHLDGRTLSDLVPAQAFLLAKVRAKRAKERAAIPA